MTDNSLTLALEGEVTLDQLQVAITGLRDLLAALTHEVGGDAPIAWEVAELLPLSALMTFAGVSPTPSAVTEVIRGYDVIGGALERGNRFRFRQRCRPRPCA
jgi:hypothetical protein